MLAPYIQDEDAFCFTYGDGVADIDITAEIAFHKGHGKWATVAAVQPPGRYGALQLNGAAVTRFVEKIPGDGNGPDQRRLLRTLSVLPATYRRRFDKLGSRTPGFIGPRESADGI